MQERGLAKDPQLPAHSPRPLNPRLPPESAHTVCRASGLTFLPLLRSDIEVTMHTHQARAQTLDRLNVPLNLLKDISNKQNQKNSTSREWEQGCLCQFCR